MHSVTTGCRDSGLGWLSLTGWKAHSVQAASLWCSWDHSRDFTCTNKLGFGDASANSSPSAFSYVLGSDYFLFARIALSQRARKEAHGKSNHMWIEQLATYSCHSKAPVHGWHPKRMQEPNSCLPPFNWPDGYPSMSQQMSNWFLHSFQFPKLKQDSNNKENWESIKALP